MLSYSLYVPSLLLSAHFRDIQIYQAVKGTIDSYDALIDLFESTEHFLNRLDIYTRIPPTVAMTGVVVKLLVELLSTLALATKQIKEGKSSGSIFDEVLCYLTRTIQCRKACYEVLWWREGHRGGTETAGPTHSRRGSGDHSTHIRGRLWPISEYESGNGR